jgi:hypothetical protein
MGEIGCLKDGNFQNLEASTIMLGNSTLRVAGFVNIGTAGGVAQTTAATSLVKNSVHIINGDIDGTDSMTVTLPALAEVPAVGDFYTFLLACKSELTAGTGNGHTIKLPAAGPGGGNMFGAVKLCRVPVAGTALADTTADGQTIDVRVSPVPGTDEMIEMQSDDATGGGEAGSWITCTFMGLTDGTNPSWYITGEIISLTAASTGNTTFDAFA